VFEIIKAGGWMMIPIIASGVISLAICMERIWSLRESIIMPPNLLGAIWASIKNKQLDAAKIREFKEGSPLGAILMAGVMNAKYGREIMRESIEETANHVIHELERFLNLLGTIAAAAPLLGLLGTVVGMIHMFTQMMASGHNTAEMFSGGVSTALVTTASGLVVAIPSLFFHRYFTRRIDDIVITMEQESLKLVEIMQGERDSEAEAS
jgi:biopolymer transport protein ExbB